jgi:predicted small metal-binding protein
MAQKEYKELSCRSTGADCDFVVRAETDEEGIRVLTEHACRAHNLCEIASNVKEMMNSMAKSVCGEGKCAFVREAERQAPMGEWMEN